MCGFVTELMILLIVILNSHSNFGKLLLPKALNVILGLQF